MRMLAILVVYTIVLAAGLGVAFQPTLESRFALLQTDDGDTLLNHYLLEHSWRAVADRSYLHSLWSPPFYYPEPYCLGYSETLLGVAPVYWGLRCVLPPDLAYPVWMMVLSALNFIAFAAIARRLKCGHAETILGAYLWAFAVVHLYQSQHQQLIPRFWMPFAAFHVIRFVQGPNARDLGYGLVFIALQAAACVNSGVLLGLGIFVFSVVALSINRGWRQLRTAIANDHRGFLLAFVLGCGLCIVALLPQIIANIGSGTARTYEESIEFIPMLMNWFTPPPQWHLWFSDPLRETNHECYLFGGFGYGVLFLIALLRGPRSIGYACALTAFTLFVLTLRTPTGESLWQVVRFFPGGVSIRVVSRIYMPVFLFITLGGVLNLRYVKRPWVRWLAVFVIAEQAAYTPASFDPAPIRASIRQLADLMKGADVAYVIDAKPETWDVHLQIRTMWAGLDARVPVMNGYSGRMPNGYPYCGPDCTDDVIRRWVGPGRIAIIDPVQMTVRFLP